MGDKTIMYDSDWIMLTSYTREPKLSYIISKLKQAGIESVRVRVGYETRLFVPYNKIAESWKVLKPEIDGMRDDHPFFYRWKRATKSSD